MQFVIILFSMIFCHIIDDFHLQGCMKDMKQKSWWQKQTTDKKYKYDYLVVLMLHAFSWTFTIFIPYTIYMVVTNNFINTTLFLSIFVINWIIHFIVDNEKANKLTINLVVDQFIHLAQIVVTWLIFYIACERMIL